MFGERSVLQHLLVNACRIAFGALALAAAQWATPIPLYVAVALGGVLLLGLPLRHFRVSRAVALGGWLLAFGVVAATREGAIPRDALRAVVSTVVLGLVLVAGFAILTEASESDLQSRRRLSRFLRGHGPDIFAIPAVGSGFIAGGGLLILSIAFIVMDSRPLGWSALILAIVCVSGATAVATVAGVLHGVGASRRPTWRFPYPSPFRARQVTAPANPRRPTGEEPYSIRLAFMFRLFFMRVLQRIAVAANLFLRIVTRAAYLVVKAVCNALDWTWVRIVLVLTAIADAARTTLKTIIASIVAALGALRPWARSLVTTVGLLILSALVAVYAASRFTLYLSGGEIDRGVEAICLFAAALALGAAVWWSTTRTPRRSVISSAARSLEFGGPSIFLTVLALAWGDGILGWLGVGPIRPGWFTYAGTIVLLVGSLFFMRKTPQQSTTAVGS